MGRYKCSSCGYDGDKLIYQFNVFTYCVASNEVEPDYLDACPDWVREQGLGEAEIGKPVGCPACRGWGVNNFREEYVRQAEQQSWNLFIGHRFQGVVHAILKGITKKLQDERQSLKGLKVLTAEEAKRDEIIMRKLAVNHGDFLLLPDFDSAIVWMDPEHKWESRILAVIARKTSLA